MNKKSNPPNRIDLKNQIKTLINEMDIPSHRKVIVNNDDIRWLHRKLGLRNRSHPNYQQAYTLICQALGETT
jgi:hypothetical protein